MDPPRTPDGRYIVVRGRLWRATNPGLDAATRERETKRLMRARSAVGRATRTKDAAAEKAARAEVDAASGRSASAARRGGRMGRPT